MKTTKILHLAAILLTAIAVTGARCAAQSPRGQKPPSAQAATDYAKNGDFEKVINGSFADWKISGNVKPRAISGVWRKMTAKFRTETYSKVGFFFTMNQGSTGSLWIDNITVDPKAEPQNPSFEELDADGHPLAWNQDGWGKTIFSDSTRASDGKRSIRFTHDSEALPDSLVWQDIPVEPGKEYSISFDLFIGDDFQGEAKGWLYEPTHATSLDFEINNLLASTLVEERDRLDRYAVTLTPTAGSPAVLTQDVTVQPNAHLFASVDYENSAFNGTVKLSIEDAASGKALKQLEVGDKREKWQSMQVSFQSTSPKLRVRILAEGEGTLQVDNVAITPPRIVPPLQQVKWLPASKDFTIPSTLKVYVQGQTGTAVDGGLALLSKDLKPYSIAVEKSDSSKAPVKILIGAKYEVKGKGDEAYSLAVNPSGVTIKAAKEAGAFYGLMTLLQLIESQEGKPVFLPCEVTDYPDIPMRGVLYGPGEEQAARWKMNTVMESTGYPDTPQKKQDMRDLMAKCKSLNLEVIPYFMTMSGGYYVEQRNPNLVAGIWVQDEKLSLKGLEPTPLAHPYLIRTGLTDLKLKSTDGSREYKLGEDYTVIPGEIAYPYTDKNAKPFAVARVAGSSIPDGGTVLASYDYVSHVRNREEPHIAYVPLEPETRKLMDDFLRDFAKEFPVRYINTSNDLHEFGPTDYQLATDSRVIKSGKKPIELLVEEDKYQTAALQQGNPDEHILQWAGNVGDYVKAAGPHLPKDMLINIWGYDASWPAGYGREAVEYWTKLGFKTSVMPWNNLRNVRGWAQVVAEARRKGYPCLGIIDSCWTGTPNSAGGMKETAVVSWKVPKKGEKGYIALPTTH